MIRRGALARKRALARAALWWEAAWPAAWPPLGLLGLFLVFALLGVPAMLPGWLHALALLGFAAALGWTLRRAVAGFSRPSRGAADRRLEQASGLAHRPLQALQDTPAAADPAAMALWQAHQSRMRALLARLRVGTPHPGLPSRDPRALRGALVVALGAALVIGGPEGPRLLGRALLPDFSLGGPAPPLRLEAWITPPAYTGAPPQFLSAPGADLVAPLGSEFRIALSGGSGTPELRGLDGVDFAPVGAGSHNLRAPLDQSARVLLRQGGRDVALWNITVQPDTPPSVRFTEEPGRAARGLALRLPWAVRDDWGVVGLRAIITLAPRPEAEPLRLDLSVPAPAPREAEGTALFDLTAHPWAGLPVFVELVAEDGAGLTGRSGTMRAMLPERSFNHPVARALIGLRRDLSRDPDSLPHAVHVLGMLAAAPDAFDNDWATLLALRVARTTLGRGRDTGTIPEAQALLWEAALALEEGRDGRTARALAEARRALREALDQAAATPDDNDPERAAAEARIAELREAIRRHLEALADRLQHENAEEMPYDPQQRLLNQRDMQRRTERMEEANRQNRIEDARRELAELERVLEALEQGRMGAGETPEQQRARERGEQQMSAVQDLSRRQTALLDEAQRRAEQLQRREALERWQGSPWHMRQRPAEPLDPRVRPISPEEAAAAARAESHVQQALRRALGELMAQFGELTGEVPESLGRADQAMREAVEALRGNADPRPAQQEAIRNLQEGGRAMAQQMQRQFGQGGGQGQGGDGMGADDGEGMFGDDEYGMGEGQDPLGRQRGGVGSAQTEGETRVPDEAEALRTRRLQEELRRRGAERHRPTEELDYIDRLLRRF